MNQQSPSDNSIPLAPILIFFGGLALILAALFAGRPAANPDTVTRTPVVISMATAVPANLVSAAGLDSQKVAAGESIFQSVCYACHGFNAKGIPGLGKTLVDSTFVNSLSDDDLLAFIIRGRPVTDPLNTTGVQMPPRGGNPNLKDDDLRNVIAYIRSLNGSQVAPPSADQAAALALTPTLPPAVFNAGAISSLLGTSNTAASTPVSETPNPTASSNTAASTPVSVTPVPTTTTSTNTFANPGAADYVRACAGCHGVDGKGQPFITKPLADSELLKTQNSIGILALFTTEQPPVDPDVQFQHPYRGGYPELSDNQLLGIITYLITLPK